MSRLIRSAVLCLLSLLVAACVPEPYRPPTSDQPHAVLKIRRTYEVVAGTSLTEGVMLNDNRAFYDEVPAEVGRAPRTDALLVHPEPAHVRFATEFSHSEMRTVQEQYTEQVPHQETETYDCSTGFGASRSYRTCTRFVTRYRTETKWRWVTKPVVVSDGSCDQLIDFAVAVNAVYLLEYTYRDRGACSLACFEQKPDPALGAGSFHNAPCVAAPAPP